MSHELSEVGKPCPTCKHAIVLHEFHGMDPYTGCSEFCASVREKELQEFLAAKPGDFCVYPCPECGTPTEGEWYPGEPNRTICSDCGPKVKLARRTELLRKIRTLLERTRESATEMAIRKPDDAHFVSAQVKEMIPESLLKEIDDELSP